MTGMDMQMSHPAVTGIGMGSSVALRRLSVDQLLAEPLQTYSSGVFGGSYPAVADPFQSKVESHTYGPVVDNLGMDDDDDVEEIQRNEMYSNFPNSTRFMVNPGYPSHISIPRPLAPLPQLLLGNPKNLMYFDHYLKHTARLLVIHDCSENPFKHILPQSKFRPSFLVA